MYLLLVLLVYVGFAYYFVDWKNWKDYYPTVQYFIICNLLYNFLFYNHTLWKYNAITTDWLNHTFIDLAFTFFIVPIVIMIYLRYYPNGAKQYLYIGIWIAYFSFLEYLFYKKDMFLYDNGWNPLWSTVFNIILFTMVRLHFKRPLMALVVSVPVIAILLMMFHPPLNSLK
ncbi:MULTISPECIES: CBO0543 family protein [Bacillaceae]|uniref:Uncharacterized protein n=1 Tax=Evansella alkalicola TaxID=745819 RepID=A0ABS6JXE0_9BACI|nr:MULTISPECIES: CBO0543 family protein [Bacillaceae]MBU9723264.1 hypothetical protein [Bacillus alkalicola]